MEAKKAYSSPKVCSEALTVGVFGSYSRGNRSKGRGKKRGHHRHLFWWWKA